MTTLEAVSIERILSPGEPVPGRQAEDLSPQEIARVMVAIQRMRRDKIEEIKDLAIGAQLADDAKEREAYLQKQAEAQFAVKEDKLVEAVRDLLKRHGID